MAGSTTGVIGSIADARFPIWQGGDGGAAKTTRPPDRTRMGRGKRRAHPLSEKPVEYAAATRASNGRGKDRKGEQIDVCPDFQWRAVRGRLPKVRPSRQRQVRDHRKIEGVHARAVAASAGTPTRKDGGGRDTRSIGVLRLLKEAGDWNRVIYCSSEACYCFVRI